MTLRPSIAGAIVVVVVCAAVVAGCGGSSEAKPAPKPEHGAAPWAAPADPLGRTVAAGLRPEPKEHLTYHVHAHLDVFVNGKHVTVPAGIGINIKDPEVKVFTDTPDGSKAYGGIELCAKACISPLHTHDNTGIVHTESATATGNRLGQFFTEWGVPLSRTCVGGYCRPSDIGFYVDGKRYKDDPRTIALWDRREIAIVIGTPPEEIPKTADFSNP
jgi:hypothetical protein